MPTKALFLSSAKASTSDLSRGYANWHLSDPLRFSIGTDKPLQWGGDVKAIRIPEISVHDLSYINFFINVSAANANNTITYSDDPLTPLKYVCTIPDGCYDISTFNSAVVAHQISTTTKYVFDFKPNYNTGKAYIEFKEAGWYVNFTANNTLLGFTAGFYPADKISSVGEIITATNQAFFNIVENVVVHSNLTNNAISGVSASNVIYQSIPNVSIGYSQRDEPSNLIWIPSEVLMGSVTNITIELKDQLDRPINMTENFSLTLLIQY